ncbi:MAG: DUF4173 domain-containing protein [Candidatus Magasanikbacteria bacterium]|nr:DUF4173 domain-containing protein [Candidatus Magasanikbacteria bacterium]
MNLDFVNANASSKSRNNRLIWLGFAAVISILYDFFFWQQEPGIGFAIYVLLYTTGFLIIANLTVVLRQRQAWWLLAPIVILSLDRVLLNNEFVRQAGGAMVLVLSAVFALLATMQNPAKHTFHFRGFPVVRRIDLLFMKWSDMYKDVFLWHDDPRKQLVRRILLGLVIAIPFLIIFAWLFNKADAVFAEGLADLFNIEKIPEFAWRVLRTVALALFAGGFYYATALHDSVLASVNDLARELDQVIVAVVLALINVLFGAFVFIQFKYLFGSAEFVLKNGLTFADYARQGFFELSWVIGLSALFLVVVYRAFVGREKSKIVSVFTTLLVLQVGAIAASALRRMNLYQFEYGYTVLRLYVEWFIYFILALLSLTAACFWIRVAFRRFFYIVLISGVAALTMVASVNVDYIITRENVRRFMAENQPLDLDYIAELSTDSLPALTLLFSKDVLPRLSVDQKLKLNSIRSAAIYNLKNHTAARSFNQSAYKGAAVALASEGAFNWAGLERQDRLFQAGRNLASYSELRSQDCAISNSYFSGTAPRLARAERSAACSFTEAGNNRLIVLEYIMPTSTLDDVPRGQNVTSYEARVFLYQWEYERGGRNPKLVKRFERTLPEIVSPNTASGASYPYTLLRNSSVLLRAATEHKTYLYNWVFGQGGKVDIVRSKPLEEQVVFRFSPSVAVKNQKPYLLYGDPRISFAPKGQDVVEISCQGGARITCVRLDATAYNADIWAARYSPDHSRCTTPLSVFSSGSNWYDMLAATCE